MAIISDKAIGVVDKFIKLTKKSGIHIERAVLFGSYANKKAHKWSDIDIAIVSSDFCGIPFYDRDKLLPFILETDTGIEPHPFRPEDWTEEDYFVAEIIKTGIEIKV
ncbi:hypothetical protein AUJ95_02450 [Candidatus Desantisbacteria bacterium CG2_30_40_21]|uniref:Nucleotidyltransferase domain-containing protein n=3 Tax=unclassified Candidatus Desantisiibacteriota TaxID=3106372 RepID=A0A2M7P3T6_9BACT|nr:MAG: hypothetical protein AUJ95_02450 [Candidatus Desantisbacteria bacterium CG2_30_40_21]PIP40202.1 MAG: nucleotidyltransferase [Candidatus Desantisbacteria bacterium CG23_combo_of_CG06-09_8_20_14_all_40_23]PIY20345.1 MAG: nucleotidyltransferase domain-containing protein [Candidatus Desantisbacteria bacterium CG_4_10_14_3_um_filter_40_18]